MVVPEVQAQKSVYLEQCQVLREVQTNIVQIQEVIGYEDNEPMSEDFSLLKTLAEPFQELQRCIAHVTQDYSQEDLVEMKCWTDINLLTKLAKPIRDIAGELGIISQQHCLETVKSLTSQQSIGALKALAMPLIDLQNCIATIQHEFIDYESHDQLKSHKFELQTARPLEELRQTVEILLHNVVEYQDDSSTMDDVSGFKSLSDIANEAVSSFSEMESKYKIKFDIQKYKDALPNFNINIHFTFICL